MRKKYSWTLDALAHQTHYSYSMIRSIEKGISNLDEEGRNQFAHLFDFPSFKNNMQEKEKLLAQINEIDFLHCSLQNEKRKELIDQILSDRFLIASFLFPQYLLIELYKLVCDEEDEKKIEELRSLIESGIEFYSSKELAIYYHLLGIHANDIDSETSYLLQAYFYDPNSFMINLHLSMNTYFRQKLTEALQYLNRCKSLVFQYGSYFRFIQLSLLEAQIRIDLGDYQSSLQCLNRILLEKSVLDSDLYESCLSLLAYGHFRKKDSLNALIYAQQALQTTSEKPFLYLIIIFSAFRLNDSCFYSFVYKAKDFLLDNKKMVNSFDELIPWSLLIDGIVAWYQSNYYLAIENFKESIKAFDMDPLRSWILECLIELSEKSENLEWALHYQKELTDLVQNQTLSDSV
ncbi:hypothetical protein [Dubosiella newyorkensis]|nr:hypothetical protein [Dubosiella newyorkensis]